ncbi:hypothetical protein OGAPHI_007031 [Ogataea philodendri]|uniref:Uncharacterized protein n=1 Tax=Ogataea philodendri TaxID=1378263 RepID=A0A9P8NVT1_9ASCO|nr:uncharacterized protein OGAPHI_007031 [Ogataea philodendri]KAH3660445.1 hypothetical protein OGAPHI_007031 [Ogataea philodendri]
MGCISTLRNIAIGVSSVVSGHRLVTVLFVVIFTTSAAQTRESLCTQTNSVTNLVMSDLWSNVNNLTNDLMSNNLWELDLTPTFATHGSHDVGSTKAATLNFNVNVMVVQLLWLKGDVLWLVPIFGVKHSKTSEFFRVFHSSTHFQ